MQTVTEDDSVSVRLTTDAGTGWETPHTPYEVRTELSVSFACAWVEFRRHQTTSPFLSSPPAPRTCQQRVTDLPPA